MIIQGTVCMSFKNVHINLLSNGDKLDYEEHLNVKLNVKINT